MLLTGSWDVIDSCVVLMKDLEIISRDHASLSPQLTEPPVHLVVEVLLHHRDNVPLSEGELIP